MKSKQETIDEMKKQIEELSKNLTELENSKDNIEFLDTGYFVDYGGEIDTVVNTIWFGNKRALTFATEDIAKNVDAITQKSYKIAQYVFQKEPDYIPDWEGIMEEKYIIYFFRGTYYMRVCLENIYEGVVYMPKHVAEQFVEDLNNGDYSID